MSRKRKFGTGDPMEYVKETLSQDVDSRIKEYDLWIMYTSWCERRKTHPATRIRVHEAVLPLCSTTANGLYIGIRSTECASYFVGTAELYLASGRAKLNSLHSVFCKTLRSDYNAWCRETANTRLNKDTLTEQLTAMGVRCGSSRYWGVEGPGSSTQADIYDPTRSVEQFLDARCKRGGEIPKPLLLTVYKAYCEVNSVPQRSNKVFGMELKRWVGSALSMTNRVYTGVSLK